jgi:hypothetical protein
MDPQLYLSFDHRLLDKVNFFRSTHTRLFLRKKPAGAYTFRLQVNQRLRPDEMAFGMADNLVQAKACNVVLNEVQKDGTLNVVAAETMWVEAFCDDMFREEGKEAIEFGGGREVGIVFTVHK